MSGCGRTGEGFISAAGIAERVTGMGLLDNLRKKKDVMCPECEKEQRHVRLVETNGKSMECPECHYMEKIRR